MLRRPRAIALITVLMMSVVLLIVVLTGIQLTGRNLFLMAKAHDRNQALYAAEAGVYKTLAEIETLNRYPADGLRPVVQLSNGAGYQVELTRVGDVITLRSTGTSARAQRILEVSVTLSPDSFYAVTTEGPIGLADDTFINAVLSTLNPKPGRGNIHTNSSSKDAIIPELTDPKQGQRLSVTGEATAVGAIKATIEGKGTPSAGFVNPVKVNRDDLLGSESYTIINTLPADGIIRGHQRIPSVDWEGAPLFIEEGAVLHVSGDLALAHSVTGSGTLVVDGEALIRGNTQIDLNNGKGILMYAGGGVSLIHPEAVRETLSIKDFAPSPDPNIPQRPSVSRETFHHEPDPLSTYFAERPVDTEFNLRQGMPLDAPTDLEFFEYYETQILSPSEAFRLWVEGDNTIEFPGLRPEVKVWLEKSAKEPNVKKRIHEMRVQK